MCNRTYGAKNPKCGSHRQNFKNDLLSWKVATMKRENAICTLLPTVFTQFGNGTVTNCKLASLKNMVGNVLQLCKGRV